MPQGVHLSSVGERKLSAILYEHCIVALGVCGAIRSSTQQHAAARDPFSIGLGALRFDFSKLSLLIVLSMLLLLLLLDLGYSWIEALPFLLIYNGKRRNCG